MFASLKSEFRKILSVRSTYVITGLATLLVAFYAFYIEGIRAGVTVMDPHKLASEVTGAIVTVAFIGSLVGVLLVTHEYRYNTIVYTLAASRSRTKTLFAKMLAVSVFAVLFGLFIAAFSPAMTYLGAHVVKGLEFGHQNFDVWSLLWRSVFYTWGFATAGVLIAFLIRSQVGAIAALILIPNTIELLLGLLLKKDVAYLPFTSLGAVVEHQARLTPTSYGHAALIFLGYLAVTTIIAWQLFVRRDAN